MRLNDLILETLREQHPGVEFGVQIQDAKTGRSALIIGGVELQAGGAEHWCDLDDPVRVEQGVNIYRRSTQMTLDRLRAAVTTHLSS